MSIRLQLLHIGAGKKIGLATAVPLLLTDSENRQSVWPLSPKIANFERGCTFNIS
jgi:hypothetical protein